MPEEWTNAHEATSITLAPSVADADNVQAGMEGLAQLVADLEGAVPYAYAVTVDPPVAGASDAQGALVALAMALDELDPSLHGALLAGNDAGGLPIAGLADPTNPQDAATKAYVDAAAPAGPATLSRMVRSGTFVEDTVAFDGDLHVKWDTEIESVGNSAVFPFSGIDVSGPPSNPPYYTVAFHTPGVYAITAAVWITPHVDGGVPTYVGVSVRLKSSQNVEVHVDKMVPIIGDGVEQKVSVSATAYIAADGYSLVQVDVVGDAEGLDFYPALLIVQRVA